MLLFTSSLFIYILGLQCISQIVYAENSCADGVCSCDIGYISNSDNTKCLPHVTEYLGRCTDDNQCKWFGENSECKSFCICQENYRWYQGKCQKYVGLGKPCETNDECYDGIDPLALICNDALPKTCSCNPSTHYLRGNTANDPDANCRKKSKNGGNCAIDLDCQDTTLVCNIGKCQQRSTLAYYKLLEPEEYSLTANTDKPLTCTKDSDCTENANCYNSICTCKQGYFLANVNDEDKCIPEIGINSGCKKNSDCLIRPGVCDVQTGICYCREYYALEDGNRKCVKTMTQNNINCLSAEWCSVLGPHAFCSSAGVCNCSQVAELDESNMLCHLKGNEDPSLCRKNTDCTSVNLLNGECIDEKCQCAAGYRPDDTNTKCLPDIGSYCNEDYDMPCTLDLTYCSDKEVCECEENYVQYENKKCYPIKNQIGEDCDVDVQCAVLFSQCLENTCRCVDSHNITLNNMCFENKKIGDYCANELVCKASLGETFVCRKQKCTCPTDSTLVGDKCSGASEISGSFLLLFIVLIVNCISSFGC